VEAGAAAGRADEDAPDPYRALTIEALAAYCGLGVPTLRKYIHDPIDPLPAYQLRGRMLMVFTCDFAAWLRRQPSATTSERRRGPDPDDASWVRDLG
jgi:hypothetical protein